MPRAWPGSPEVRAKIRSWVARCTPVFHRLAPLMTQPSPSDSRARLQPGRVRAVLRLGESECHRPLAGDQRLAPLALLCVGAEPVHHDHLRKIADDRRLVLQVVVQPEALVRQVFPDDRHVKVGPVAATEPRRQPVAQPAGLVGAGAHLAEQVLPRPRRDATVVQVGAGELAMPVEVLHVLAFQRFDLGLDERVHLRQQSPEGVPGVRNPQCSPLAELLALEPVQRLLPYRRQRCDGVLVADLNPRADGRRNTVVKFSKSRAMAAATYWGCRSRAYPCSWARRTDAATMSMPNCRNSFCTAANRCWVAPSWATATMMPMFCLNMFQ